MFTVSLLFAVIVFGFSQPPHNGPGVLHNAAKRTNMVSRNRVRSSDPMAGRPIRVIQDKGRRLMHIIHYSGTHVHHHVPELERRPHRGDGNR
jgi:hypothetical protein